MLLSSFLGNVIQESGSLVIYNFESLENFLLHHYLPYFKELGPNII